MHNAAMHEIEVHVYVQSAVRDALMQRREPQQDLARYPCLFCFPFMCSCWADDFGIVRMRRR